MQIANPESVLVNDVAVVNNSHGEGREIQFLPLGFKALGEPGECVAGVGLLCHCASGKNKREYNSRKCPDPCDSSYRASQTVRWVRIRERLDRSSFLNWEEELVPSVT